MKAVEYTYNQNYNKILVVGHPMSNQKVMIELLNTVGMSIAKPLKQHAIEATEISQILSQYYNPRGETKEQIKIDKVWDGLALDLFMSNRDKKWWGWSDSEALPYLNYWKSIDSKFAFIFIYDTPEIFIKKVLSKSDVLSYDSISKTINEWYEYNEALLKFYYRNNECSLLINTEQIKLKTAECLQQVSRQIGLNSTKIDNKAIVKLQERFKDEEDDPLFSYLIDKFLKENSNITNIFEELQSVANLPFSISNEKKYSSVEALIALQNDKKHSNKLQEKISSLKKSNNIYQSKITHLENKQKKLLEQEKLKISENEELFAQLISVQEELEKYYLVSQKSSKELDFLEKSLQEKKKENEELKVKLDSIQSKQKKLSEQEKLKISENEEILRHLMSAQEELEKYYLENKRLKEKQQKVQRYYGASERIKKQLRYRIGKKITEKYKSILGIFSLPFSLLLVYLDYKKDKKKMTEKKLPPISKYADAYEVPRIKRHHAYRIGDVVISSLQSPFGIFTLPSKLFKLANEFKKEQNNG